MSDEQEQPTISFLQETQQRYDEIRASYNYHEAQCRRLMARMNEMIPAIWALEAEQKKQIRAVDDGEAMRKADTDASRDPISALTPEDGNDALLADQQVTPPQSNAQASEADAAMPCTCHPDDQPPHCQHKYAAGDCQRAYRSSVLRDAVEAAGLIYWDGGECPLAEAEFVNIVLRGGGGEGGQAGSMDWEHSETQSHRNDLIAYQLQSVSNARFSEGASARRSGLQQGDNPYPAPTFDCAHESAHYKWLQGWLSADEFATDAERIGSDSLTTDDDRVALHDQPALTQEQFEALDPVDFTKPAPVIDAEPPSIPRSEIPEGVAVETFTEQGVETVKIGGLTHIVEGEAPVDKFSAIRDGGDAGFWAAARGLTKIEEMA